MLADRPEVTDVVIVGAGPTGLTAAVRLAELGVPHLIFDAAAAPSQTSKAALVHASTLEVLAELGVGDQLVEAGRKLHRIVIIDRSKVLARVELTGIPSKYAFALSVPQSTTEEVLLRRLVGLGGSVRRQHRVNSVREEGNGYLVAGTMETERKTVPIEIKARYVVGADGSRSVVRSAIGLDFPGETYPSQFVLADVELTAQPSADDEATINMSAHGVTVIGRLPSGNYRIIATVDPGSDVPEAPDMAYMDEVLSERGFAVGLTSEPRWSSRFRIHHRVADNFRVGGVFLTGDAAHVHSPAAGQGMNTGIADAYDLATRLAAVILGQVGTSALDGYEENRRAAALEVVRFTDRMTRIATLRNPVARSVRGAAARRLSRIRPIRDRVTIWITGLTILVRATWNGKDFYVSFGEGARRDWDDAKTYGFVAAGDGEWYSRSLQQLKPGHHVFTYVPKGNGVGGYVAVGDVTGEAMLAKDFQVHQDGRNQPYLEVAQAPDAGKDRDDPALAEWIVPVRWIEARDRTNAVKDSDFFANQNSAVKLTHGYTLKNLLEAFGLEDDLAREHSQDLSSSRATHGSGARS